MADRHPADHERRTARLATDPTPRGGVDAPLVDLIFPNREQPRARGYEPSVADLDRAEGFGPPERDAFQHRRTGKVGRVLGAGKRTKRVRVTSGGLTDRPVRRRRLLLGLGTGAVVAGGVGGAAAWLTGAIGSPTSKRRPDTTAGLGAAGLA